jgi:hypothetical protein
MLSPQESLQKIGTVCQEMGIGMLPVKISVPFALNLIQLFDGRVLMTGGDKEVFETVEKIVGKGKVIQTSIPIRYFPLYGRGGIRCLVTHVPAALIEKADPAPAFVFRMLMRLCSLLVRRESKINAV